MNRYVQNSNSSKRNITDWLVIFRIVLKKKLGDKSIYVVLRNNIWAIYLTYRKDSLRFQWRGNIIDSGYSIKYGMLCIMREKILWCFMQTRDVKNARKLRVGFGGWLKLSRQESEDQKRGSKCGQVSVCWFALFLVKERKWRAEVSRQNFVWQWKDVPGLLNSIQFTFSFLHGKFHQWKESSRFG